MDLLSIETYDDGRRALVAWVRASRATLRVDFHSFRRAFASAGGIVLTIDVDART